MAHWNRQTTEEAKQEFRAVIFEEIKDGGVTYNPAKKLITAEIDRIRHIVAKTFNDQPHSPRVVTAAAQIQLNLIDNWSPERLMDTFLQIFEAACPDVLKGAVIAFLTDEGYDPDQETTRLLESMLAAYLDMAVKKNMHDRMAEAVEKVLQEK